MLLDPLRSLFSLAIFTEGFDKSPCTSRLYRCIGENIEILCISKIICAVSNPRTCTARQKETFLPAFVLLPEQDGRARLIQRALNCSGYTYKDDLEFVTGFHSCGGMREIEVQTTKIFYKSRLR